MNGIGKGPAHPQEFKYGESKTSEMKTINPTLASTNGLRIAMENFTMEIHTSSSKPSITGPEDLIMIFTSGLARTAVRMSMVLQPIRQWN